jgi:Fic family protein
MTFDPTKPFNDLPDLPPAGEIETKEVLKLCIEARAALARVDAEARLLPNPDVLINSMSLLEAKDSSEIENIVTTQDELFKQAQLGDAHMDSATKEALGYRAALFEGWKSLKEHPLSTRTAVRVCQRLKGAEFDIRKVPGTTLKNDRTGEVIYTPPAGEELLRAKLANWEKFIHEATHLDPLVRLAIQHYQFEAIHPFIDGNGRTGRILNVLFLIEQGLLSYPVIYLSREILAERDVYYMGFQDVTTDAEWQDWIEFFLLLVQESAMRSLLTINQIRILILHTQIYLREVAPKLAYREIVDLLFEQPYSRISNIVDKGIAKRQTASDYLQRLVTLGVLTELKVGNEKLFLHTKLRQLLAGDAGSITCYKLNALAPDELLFPNLTARTS